MTNIITREFDGKVFSFREDGYFNMTKAAQAFGKDLSNFMRSPDTKDYIESFSVIFTELKIVDSKTGRYNGGTWGHPKLAVFFARWLSPKFAVFCDMVIDDILNKKAELTITKSEESMVMKVPQTFAEALRLAADLSEQNEVMRQELEIVTIDEYRALTHRYMSHSYKVRLSHQAKKLAEEEKVKLDTQIRTLPTGREVTIKVYPRSLLERAELALS